MQRNRSAGGAKLYVISVFKVQLVSYDKNQYITEWDLLARVKFHNLEINQNRKKTEDRMILFTGEYSLFL